MPNIQNYKCPACGGPLKYNASSANLVCEYCDSSYSAEEMEKPVQENVPAAASTASETNGSQWNTDSLSSDWGEAAGSMKEYTCPSCGAGIICEQTTAATCCPYCNNPAVVETQFAGALKPDYIIPFKVNKKEAVAKLKEFYNGKPLLPDEFSDKNKLEEINALYVPFWFFDGSASGRVVFDTSTVSYQTRGPDKYRITKNYECTRAGNVKFKMVPVDASKKMSDDLMDSLEPYDYKDLTQFSTAYLPGYVANIHDVSAEECFERADTRYEKTCVNILKDTVTGYDTCSVNQKQIDIHKGNVYYGLLPVYLLNTDFDGKKYTFAINGQTGKVVGELPSSTKKAFKLFLSKFLISLIVSTGIGTLLLYFMGA